MFFAVNYIIPYICINLFQDQLFHNFARDQCQDEKPVITLVILFTGFWNCVFVWVCVCVCVRACVK